MDPDLKARALDLILKLLPVLFGWLLGVTNTLVVEGRKARQKGLRVRTGIALELRDLQYRLVHTALHAHAFYGHGRHGTFDLAFVEWMHGIVSAYKGPVTSRSEEMAALLAKVGSTEEMAAAYARALRESVRTPATAASEMHVPLLESSFADLKDQEPDYQARVLDIYSQLKMFNEQVSEAMALEGQTLGNTGIMIRPDSAHLRYGLRAKLVASKIAELAAAYPVLGT